MTKRGFYNKTIGVNGEKLRDALDSLPDNERGLVRISKVLLGKTGNYLTQCIQKNRINKESLDRICYAFNLNKENYIISDNATEELRIENIKKKSVKIKSSNDNLVDAITQLNQAINSLIIVELDSQKKLEAMRGNIDKMAKASMDINKLNSGIDSVDDGISRINSNLNIVNGRLKDIYRANGVQVKADI